jgi:(2R)-ethylmalonyl-CoA mutase
VIEDLTAQLLSRARTEIGNVERHGGAVDAVAYMKSALVESNRARQQAIEQGEHPVVGLNMFQTSEESPLTSGDGARVYTVDPAVEQQRRQELTSWREQRDQTAVDDALSQLAATARTGENIMPPTIAAARAGATTGEWAGTLREAFGDYRAPTGISSAAPADPEQLKELRSEVDRLSAKLGRRLKILIGKPGLDGHSNGAEQLALRARDIGMEVVYDGIRLTPAQLAASALQEDVDVIGLSILSGSHRQLVSRLMSELRQEGVTIPVVVGGIIPSRDVQVLRDEGVVGIYTPKDFDLDLIMREIIDLIHNETPH